MQQNNDIEILTKYLSKIPGFGPRSAKRAILYLINNKDNIMLPLARYLDNVANNVKKCQECGNIDNISPCYICSDIKRDVNTLCVIEDIGDLWAMERSAIYKGLYHVLGGTLSAIEGRGPDDLNIDNLIDKIQKKSIKEVIMATNATVEGQTTAHYITKLLNKFDIKISRIAQGIPIGGELDYLDDGTLGAALKARVPF